MDRIKNPPHVFKKGDRVLYTPPHDSRLSFFGVVEGWYGEDRVLVTTQSDHTWALKVEDVTLSEEN